MTRFRILQRHVTRCLWCLPAVAVIGGCVSSAKVPLASATGPTPTIPAPTPPRFPVVNVAKVVGWSGNAHPVAAPGTTVNAFARKLDHPRWVYALPNGD